MTTKTPPFHDPICGDQVTRAGEFCSWVCWTHWHAVMELRGVDIVKVSGYVELHEQPWYGTEVDNGQYTEST